MKSEIIFYDYEFNRLGRTGAATQIYHKELYNKIGTFEAELSAEDPMAQKVMQRDFTVALWDGRQAIITASEYCDSDAVIRVYGRTPNWMLSRRACPNFAKIQGSPFEIAAKLTREVWGDCMEVGIGEDIEAEEISFWRNVYNPLSEVIADCLDRCGGGHRVVFDVKNKLWRFEMFMGGEKGFLFSYDRRNMFDATVKHSILDYYNGGFYTTDSEENLWKEIKSDKEGIYCWSARLTSSGESSAKSELEGKKIQDTIDFTAASEEGIGVGDIVTVQYKTGSRRKSKKMRVAAIEAWAEKGKTGYRPILEEV